MSEEPRVLVVEDDPIVLRGCRQALQLAGLAVEAVASAEEAWRSIETERPGVVVTDIRLPGMDGMELLTRANALDPDLPVILMTGHGDVSLAVQAMKIGAHDFIEKPFSSEHLVTVARDALERRRLVLDLRALGARRDADERPEDRLIGRSPRMIRIRELVASLGATSADVLILGETGTGKELVARCLHDASPRRDGNFVAINCGGLPESLIDGELFGHAAGAFTGAAKARAGKFEHADGGTLFLDEIESMPLAAQIKLLRVLQERSLERLGSNKTIPIDCRVVAATKVDLRDLADRGLFRADLYYRLAVATLDLPPLRRRREDIGLLFEFFATQAATRYGRPKPHLDGDRLRALLAHDWPGNVRELRNAADRWVLGLAGEGPWEVANEEAASGFSEAVEAFERMLITDALERNGGSLARTCEDLRIPKTTLFDKIRRLGISRA